MDDYSIAKIINNSMYHGYYGFVDALEWAHNYDTLEPPGDVHVSDLSLL